MPPTPEKTISNADILLRLEQMMSDNQSKTTSMMTTFSEKIEKSISDLQTKIDDKFDTLKNAVDKNTSNISVMSHEIDRLKFRKELYISDIPVINNENLHMIFDKICTALGFKDNEIPSVYLRRTKPRIATPSASNTSSSNRIQIDSPHILVEFSYLNECILFKKQYFLAKKLNLSCLGYNNNKRIFINERLARHDMDIKYKALKLKKDKMLHSVIVAGGRVYVKTTKDSRSIHIDDVKDFPNEIK